MLPGVFSFRIVSCHGTHRRRLSLCADLQRLFGRQRSWKRAIHVLSPNCQRLLNNELALF